MAKRYALLQILILVLSVGTGVVILFAPHINWIDAGLILLVLFAPAMVAQIVLAGIGFSQEKGSRNRATLLIVGIVLLGFMIASTIYFLIKG